MFAVFLAVFFQDPQRPALPLERADRLAAANYLALSFTAPLPPSPEHWGQQYTAPSPLDPERRYPVARDAAALVLAAAAGHPLAAGVIAFSAAAAALAWAAAARVRHPWITSLLLAAALLAVARSRDWHMADPFPFLPLCGGALLLGGWLRRGADGEWSRSGCVGVFGGISLLALCAPPLAVAALLAVAIEGFRLARGGPFAKRVTLKTLGPALVVVGLVIGFFAARNLATTGRVFTSPAEDYIERFTTAPVWTWQTVRAPFPIPDPVIERYDELVAIPSAMWTNPVILQWFERVVEGMHYAGGVVLAIAALATALSPLSAPVRFATTLTLLLIVVALTRFEFSTSWWTLLCPSLVLLAQEGANGMASAPGIRPLYRCLAVGAALHLLTLPAAATWRPSELHYKLHKNLQEIAQKLRSSGPGQHLVFAQLEPDAHGSLEPADLPREWEAKDILVARDLGKEKNARLMEQLPGRQAWRIVILDERVGLQKLGGDAPVPAVPAKE